MYKKIAVILKKRTAFDKFIQFYFFSHYAKQYHHTTFPHGWTLGESSYKKIAFYTYSEACCSEGKKTLTSDTVLYSHA